MGTPFAEIYGVLLTVVEDYNLNDMANIDEEEFYKIGITSRSIKKRFCNKQTMPYKYQVLQEIEDISENIWDFEVFFKRLKFFRHYTPNIPFGGSLTECYLLNKEN